MNDRKAHAIRKARLRLFPPLMLGVGVGLQKAIIQLNASLSLFSSQKSSDLWLSILHPAPPPLQRNALLFLSKLVQRRGGCCAPLLTWLKHQPNPTTTPASFSPPRSSFLFVRTLRLRPVVLTPSATTLDENACDVVEATPGYHERARRSSQNEKRCEYHYRQ